MGLIIALAIAIVLFFFGYDVALLYVDDPEVARAAANALKILAIMQPMQSTQFILAGASWCWRYTLAALFHCNRHLGYQGCAGARVHCHGLMVLGLHSCVTKLFEPCHLH